MRRSAAADDQSSLLRSTSASPYGSLPTPVTVATTDRVLKSMTQTVPLGTKAVRGPPEITAWRPSEVTAEPFGRAARTTPSASAGRTSGMRRISAVRSPPSARRRSMTETSSVPPFAVNRYASPLLECPIAIPFVSGKHPQVPLGESKATGEADVVFPSALTKGTPLGKRKGGPSGDRNGTGNAGHLKSGGGPAPSFSSTSPRRL